MTEAFVKQFVCDECLEDGRSVEQQPPETLHEPEAQHGMEVARNDTTDENSAEEDEEAARTRYQYERTSEPPASPTNSEVSSSSDEVVMASAPEVDTPPPTREHQYEDRAAPGRMTSMDVLASTASYAARSQEWKPIDPRSRTTARVVPQTLQLPTVAKVVELSTQNPREDSRQDREWHTPATDPRLIANLKILSAHDLERIGRRPESLHYTARDVQDYELAYPYARRYARMVTLPDPRALFDLLGLRRRGFLRTLHGNREEFALHPTMLSAVVNADWRLESLLKHAALTPVFPSVVPAGELNTALHNYSDERLSVAPNVHASLAGSSIRIAPLLAARATWATADHGGAGERSAAQPFGVTPRIRRAAGQIRGTQPSPDAHVRPGYAAVSANRMRR